MTFTLADVNNIEFDEEISDVDYYESIQRAINHIADLLLGEFPAVALLFDQEFKGGLDESPGRQVAFRHG